MVIQYLQQQDANQTSPYTAEVSSAFIPEAFLQSSFASKSISIELFGALALTGTAEHRRVLKSL